MNNKQVSIVAIGAGNRPNKYLEYVKQHPDKAKLVGVVELNEIRRNKIAEKFNIEPSACFTDYHDFFRSSLKVDAVMICTPENMHYEPCMMAIEAGYHVLLEKPIAQTPEECIAIGEAARRKNVIVTVCHVLRYHPYFIKLKELACSGELGNIISINHRTAVGVDRAAHSFVRGPWRKESETNPMLISKCCHDIDFLLWLTKTRCRKLTSFGSLRWFKSTNAPEGSAHRCIDCQVESQCPFSAQRIYVKQHRYLYVFDNLPKDRAAKDIKIKEYLRTTDYGRCVFRSENDQVDHYVCNMQFEDQVTASMSVEAMTSSGGRKTRIMGTKADIVGDMKTFTLTDFLTGKQYIWDEDISKLPGYEGHAGGDWGIMKDFVLAVANHDEKYLSSTIDVSVESHVMGFKAEIARKRNIVAKM